MNSIEILITVGAILVLGGLLAGLAHGAPTSKEQQILDCIDRYIECTKNHLQDPLERSRCRVDFDICCDKVKGA